MRRAKKEAIRSLFDRKQKKCEQFETMTGEPVPCCGSCHAAMGEEAMDGWPSGQTLLYDDSGPVQVCCNVAALVQGGHARRRR